MGRESVGGVVPRLVGRRGAKRRGTFDRHIVDDYLVVGVEGDEHTVAPRVGRVVELVGELPPFPLRRDEILVVVRLIVLVGGILPQADVQACVVLLVARQGLGAHLHDIGAVIVAHRRVELGSVGVGVDQRTSPVGLVYAVARPSRLVEIVRWDRSVRTIDSGRWSLLAACCKQAEVLGDRLVRLSPCRDGGAGSQHDRGDEALEWFFDSTPHKH